MLIKRYRWIVTALVAFVILVLSLIPTVPKLLDGFSLADKVAHFIAYSVLGLLLFYAVERGKKTRALIIAGTLAFCYGALIEILQFFTRRQPELWDLIVNLAGSYAGAFGGALIVRRGGSRKQ